MNLLDNLKRDLEKAFRISSARAIAGGIMIATLQTRKSSVLVATEPHWKSIVDRKAVEEEYDLILTYIAKYLKEQLPHDLAKEGTHGPAPASK